MGREKRMKNESNEGFDSQGSNYSSFVSDEAPNVNRVTRWRRLESSDTDEGVAFVGRVRHFC